MLRNLVTALSTMGKALLLAVLRHLASAGLASAKARVLRFQVAAALVGIDWLSVRSAWEDAGQERQALASASAASQEVRAKKASAASQKPSEISKTEAMKNIIRTAIVVGVEGMSFSGFERTLQRMRLASAQGGNRYQATGAGRSMTAA